MPIATLSSMSHTTSNRLGIHLRQGTDLVDSGMGFWGGVCGGFTLGRGKPDAKDGKLATSQNRRKDPGLRLLPEW
ncbi:MAG: hypothetical protein OXU41_07120, partial [Gammaproteobacteria bacterium]|nr:hypothetical protein [Gammaproteobacteria bacterium]